MIRFSAGLVAVAIGVLIGGIATSRLLLVYIAIMLSAVALVALAIGVALKREELFGEAQGTAPARAGAGPVVPEHAGDREVQNRSNGYVTPRPAQESAVGPGAAFAGTGQATSGQPRGKWENRAGGDSWPSPVTAPSFPAARQAAGPFGAPAAGEPPSSRDPAVQGGGTEPRSPGAPAPSVFAPRPASTPASAPGAGPDAGQPDWFRPSGKAASADIPAPGTGALWSRANAGTTVPGDKTVPGGKGAEEQGSAEERGKPADAPAPEDHDWPARYSWPDDKPAGSGDTSDGKPAGAAGADQEGAAPESGSPLVRADAGPQDVVVPDASGTQETPDAGTADPQTPDPGTREGTALGLDGEVDAEAGEPATPRLVPDPAAEAPAPEAGKSAVPGEAEGEPSAATAAADDTRLVTVVRGVPRFHQGDCVLIRFMSDDDTQKLSVAEAREAGCTPCAACQPD